MELIRLELERAKNPKLAAYIRKLGREGRKDLHRDIAIAMYGLVRDHFEDAGQSRHATAQKLGATPSGFFGKAREQTVHDSNSAAASVVVKSSKGKRFDARALRRAHGPLSIRPRNRRALTIPVHALAYGLRVADVERRHELIPLWKKGAPRNGNPPNTLAAEIGGKITPLFLLVRKTITVPQDAGLLPTNARIMKVATEAVIGSLKEAAKT